MAHLSTQHLKNRRGWWWLKLAIPRALRHLYLSANGRPRTHVEEALETRELATANRKKHARVAHWYADFEAKRRAAAGQLPSDLTIAARWRDTLRQSTNEAELEDAREHISERANAMLEGGEPERAERIFALATAKATLRESWNAWSDEWRISGAARLKYQQSFRELMQFLGVADAPVESITAAKARAYVRWLNLDAQSERGGPLSKSSKEGRLSPLRTFWRDYVMHNELADSNPWIGHRLTGDSGPKKRPYTTEEILALLNGPERAERQDLRYPKATVLEMYALAFYTGARRGEIANRRVGDFQRVRGGYVMHIRKAKTEAGERAIAIFHPIPVAVIERRIAKRTDPQAQLFAEFTPSGPDKCLGENVGKSMGHYRDAVGIGTEADFHSTRRQLITELVAKGHSKELVQFYVGHKVPGVTGIYAQPTDEGMRKIARAVCYPPKIENAFKRALDL